MEEVCTCLSSFKRFLFSLLDRVCDSVDNPLFLLVISVMEIFVRMSRVYTVEDARIEIQAIKQEKAILEELLDRIQREKRNIQIKEGDVAPSKR